MEINLGFYPKQKTGVLRQQMADTSILLDMESGEYFALNEVSDRIWTLCDGTRTIPEMVSIISQEYEAPFEEIEADLVEIVESLKEAKLVIDDC